MEEKHRRKHEEGSQRRRNIMRNSTLKVKGCIIAITMMIGVNHPIGIGIGLEPKAIPRNLR